MDRTLDIIVTHWHEPVEIVDRFLHSLRVQTFKNFRVTIVDDGFDCPDLNCLVEHYKTVHDLDIVYLKKEHKTVSAARNYGMRHASSKYLMFCDCDDMFDDANPSGLEHAIRRCEMNGLRVYRSTIKYETWEKSAGSMLSAIYKGDNDDRLVTMASKNINSSTVHCKIYLRSFIDKMNLKFIDDLSMNEDGVFNSLAYNMCIIYHLSAFNDCELFYIWKHNENSVTRRNRMYPLKGYDQFITATAYVDRTLKNICKFDIIEAAKFMFQSYYWLHLYSDRFSKEEEYTACVSSAMKMMKQYAREFMPKLDMLYFRRPEMEEYANRFMKQDNNIEMSGKKSLEEWLEGLYEN